MPRCSHQEGLSAQSTKYTSYSHSTSLLFSEPKELQSWRESVSSLRASPPTPPDTPPESDLLELSAMEDQFPIHSTLGEDSWFPAVNHSPMEFNYDHAMPSQNAFGATLDCQLQYSPEFCDDVDGLVDPGMSPVLTHGSQSTASFHSPSEPDYNALLENFCNDGEADVDLLSGSYPDSHSRAILPSRIPGNIPSEHSSEFWSYGAAIVPTGDGYAKYPTANQSSGFPPKSHAGPMSVPMQRYPATRPDAGPFRVDAFQHQRAPFRPLLPHGTMQSVPSVSGVSGLNPQQLYTAMPMPGPMMMDGPTQVLLGAPVPGGPGFRTSPGNFQGMLNAGSNLPIHGGVPTPVRHDMQSSDGLSYNYAPEPVKRSHGHSTASQPRAVKYEHGHAQRDGHEASTQSDPDENRFRVHAYYSAKPSADGHYHCPFRQEGRCQHAPAKLKCNYDKYIDSHVKPFRCKHQPCRELEFSSTACLLRHERETHAMHGHGNRPFPCLVDGCDRAQDGKGFPRRFNRNDHMRRVHNWSPDPSSAGADADDGVIIVDAPSSSSRGAAAGHQRRQSHKDVAAGAPRKRRAAGGQTGARRPPVPAGWMAGGDLLDSETGYVDHVPEMTGQYHHGMMYGTGSGRVAHRMRNG